MTYPVHYVPAGDVLPVFFSSYGKTNGESITLTGLAVTDIEIYKDGSTTQRSSDAGYTLLDTDGIDFDGVTGIHGFSIDTGDNTDAGFYTVGAWFHVVVSAVTIDSQTVNFIACAFRIMEAETTAGRPLTQTAAISANAITATAINADAITAAKIADGAIDAATFAAGAITATAIATDAIDADALAADAIAEINATVDTALADYDGPTKAELDAAVANVSVDEIQATALADLFNTDSGTTYASAVAGSVVKEIADNAGGSALTEAGIADAVWEEAIADHSGTAGSTAEALAAAGSAGDPWSTALPGAYGAGTAGKIIGDNINATISSRATQTSVDDLPTNAELATALGTADDAVLAAIAALNDLDAAEIRAAVGLASANLDTQLGDIPTNAELATALAAADDAVLAAIAALNNLSAVQVNAEVVDALNTDTYAEPGQGAPGATISLAQKVGYLYKAWRNRHTQTATEYALYADDAVTKDQEAAVSDDATTFERGEVGTGA